ncbi:MAG: hypothetical protein E7166_06160 [Firmicutes bacterium]|nr:hypothetical protein [Bacillota bacterium]
MKNKIIIPTILSIFVGLYLGYIIFNQYKNTSQTVFSETRTIYFLQQGVYSSKESMENNTKLLSEYIYSLDNDQYRVFVSITTDMENAKKIKNIFNNKGVDIYIKEGNISDMAFVEKLKQYDEIIKNSNDESVILELENQILSEYELVVKSNN